MSIRKRKVERIQQRKECVMKTERTFSALERILGFGERSHGGGKATTPPKPIKTIAMAQQRRAPSGRRRRRKGDGGPGRDTRASRSTSNESQPNPNVLAELPVSARFCPCPRKIKGGTGYSVEIGRDTHDCSRLPKVLVRRGAKP